MIVGLVLRSDRFQLLGRGQRTLCGRHHGHGKYQSAGDGCRRALVLEHRRWAAQLRAWREVQSEEPDQSDRAKAFSQSLQRTAFCRRAVSHWMSRIYCSIVD